MSRSRVRPVVALCLLLGACQTKGRASRLPDGRPALPALPADLAEEFGGLYQAVQERHSQALPGLAAPLDTIDEHRQWVDGELEPWMEAQRDLGGRINATRPEFPPRDADDEQVNAWERTAFVHTVLAATIDIDESIARVQVPLPRAALADPQMAEPSRQLMRMEAGKARDGIRLWESSCGDYGDGNEQIPDDLKAWRGYCVTMTRILRDRVCKLETEVGTPGPGC